MRGPLLLSVFLHIAVIVLAWVGLPSLDHPVIETPPVIDVSLVTETAEAPDILRDPMPKPEPKVARKTEPKQQQASLPKAPPPPPPAPTPPVAKPEPKEPEPKPEPGPEPAPKPEPKPEPKPKAKPEPEPEPEKKVAEPEVKAPPRPKKKPKPPPEDDFASVLKTVENLKNRPKPEKPEKAEKSFDEAMEDVLKKHNASEPEPSPRRQQTSSLNIGEKMTMSELDALRRQIERCWNPPAGAPEAENLIVEVQLVINPDGVVQQAQIVDTARMYRDSFYRAAAESVLRAIKQPGCTPLKLPPEKYDLWRETKLTFNPRELVGR